LLAWQQEQVMNKGRVEAFSDGVLAIVITIMVLELKVPHGHDISMLLPLLPIFLSYVVSFANVGIYWNNHHHMFQAVKHVGGWVLWANLHLLFWLSLMPFATAFMGENNFAPPTVALYAFDLCMCALAYQLLVQALLAEHGRDSGCCGRGDLDCAGSALCAGGLTQGQFKTCFRCLYW
jgi:uncharacterized membrane protein